MNLSDTEQQIKLGGGAKAIARQHEKNRLTARERIDKLLDKPEDGFDPHTYWLELGLWGAQGMYAEAEPFWRRAGRTHSARQVIFLH